MDRETHRHTNVNYDPYVVDHCDGPRISITVPIHGVNLIRYKYRKMDLDSYLT